MLAETLLLPDWTSPTSVADVGVDQVFRPPFSRDAEYAAMTAPPDDVVVSDGPVTDDVSATVTVCAASIGRAVSTPANAPMSATTVALDDNVQVALTIPGSATRVNRASPSVAVRSTWAASVHCDGATTVTRWLCLRDR